MQRPKSWYVNFFSSDLCLYLHLYLFLLFLTFQVLMTLISLSFPTCNYLAASLSSLTSLLGLEIISHLLIFLTPSSFRSYQSLFPFGSPMSLLIFQSQHLYIRLIYGLVITLDCKTLEEGDSSCCFSFYFFPSKISNFTLFCVTARNYSI